MDSVRHWDVWIQGSDVTNVIFYFPRQWFCHVSMSWSWLASHIMRLAKTFGKTFLKILKCNYVILSQLMGICYVSSGTNSLGSYGKLWQTHSRCLKAILKKEKKAYIIGPRLAASTYEVIFICSPASRFLLLFVFFLYIIVNILFLSPSWIGEIFHGLCAG